GLLPLPLKCAFRRAPDGGDLGEREHLLSRRGRGGGREGRRPEPGGVEGGESGAVGSSLLRRRSRDVLEDTLGVAKTRFRLVVASERRERGPQSALRHADPPVVRAKRPSTDADGVPKQRFRERGLVPGEVNLREIDLAEGDQRVVLS